MVEFLVIAMPEQKPPIPTMGHDVQTAPSYGGEEGSIFSPEDSIFLQKLGELANTLMGGREVMCATGGSEGDD